MSLQFADIPVSQFLRKARETWFLNVGHQPLLIHQLVQLDMGQLPFLHIRCISWNVFSSQVTNNIDTQF